MVKSLSTSVPVYDINRFLFHLEAAAALEKPWTLFSLQGFEVFWQQHFHSP